MANAKIRRMLLLGAISGLAFTLAACEPDFDQEQVQGSSLFSDAALDSGWSMTDLAGLEPALLSDNYSEMPQALPMQASWDGGYDYAPAYDYAPDADEYYEPLDESYYAESSGSDDYLWLALAAGLAGMLGDSPPDYAFGYDGIQPWAWETGDRYVRYAEPVYGGYRYYYYEPDAYRPFLVRDPYYSYGYREDRLMVIYDRHGRIIDGNRAYRQRLAARDYYTRGEHLYRAGNEHRRFGVPAPLWDGHRDKIRHERREWEEARRDRDDWQRWDARHQQRLHRDWAGEALVRRKAERGFANWQQADYRTPAPKFYTTENRREQLRKVAEIRREQTSERRAEQRREERLALVERRDSDRARPQNRELRERVERRGHEQPQGRFQKAALLDERASTRVERAKDRPAELRRGADDRQQRAERVAERQKMKAVQHQAEAPRQNAERKQRATAQKDRAAERRQQTQLVEQRRKEQQAQQNDHRRHAARDAEVRRERADQAEQRDARRQEQVKQKAAREARQERASKAQDQALRLAQARPQTQVRKERLAHQEAREQQPTERQQQRTEKQAERQQVERQQRRDERQVQSDQVDRQQHQAERQAQRQQAREAAQQDNKAERRKEQRAERQTQRREQTR